MMFILEYGVPVAWALFLLTAFGVQLFFAMRSVSNSRAEAAKEARAEERFREDFYA